MQGMMNEVEDEELKIRRAFAVLDSEGNGSLTRVEFRLALVSQSKDSGAPLSDAQCQAMFDAVDSNHDGLIQVNEFIAWWQHGAARVAAAVAVQPSQSQPVQTALALLVSNPGKPLPVDAIGSVIAVLPRCGETRMGYEVGDALPKDQAPPGDMYSVLVPHRRVWPCAGKGNAHIFHGNLAGTIRGYSSDAAFQAMEDKNVQVFAGFSDWSEVDVASADADWGMSVGGKFMNGGKGCGGYNHADQAQADCHQEVKHRRVRQGLLHSALQRHALPPRHKLLPKRKLAKGTAGAKRSEGR